jgi:bla regulator protein blaR1
MSFTAHLWQSTLCLLLVALLALVFRRASARMRHTIWTLASVKFLVPFSLLVVAGNYLGSFASPLTSPEVTIAIHWLDRPLSLWNLGTQSARLGGQTIVLLTLVWALGTAGLTAWRWNEWRALSKLVRVSTRLDEGREVRLLRGIRRSSPHPQQIEILQCDSTLEPGVLGIVRPKLLWPVGLSDRLSDPELESILAHEACHVDRRDNLRALIQLVVEHVFWFHPLVWWLGTRLVDARERACDEEVLQMGTDNHSYAEGILKVCGFYLRSPLTLVAGVGGSDLAARIERIVKGPRPRPVSVPARLLLAGVLTLTIGAPIVAGALSAQRSPGVAGSVNEAGAVAQDKDKPTVYGPGDGIKLPKLVREVKPDYTPEAMQAGIQGALTLEAVVLESGLVGDVEIVESLDKVYGLDDQAIKAARQWEFEPGTKDGKAVAVRIEIEFRFTLKKDGGA